MEIEKDIKIIWLINDVHENWWAILMYKSVIFMIIIRLRVN